MGEVPLQEVAHVAVFLFCLLLVFVGIRRIYRLISRIPAEQLGRRVGRLKATTFMRSYGTPALLHLGDILRAFWTLVLFAAGALVILIVGVVGISILTNPAAIMGVALLPWWMVLAGIVFLFLLFRR